uniref:Putative secreted protein n=1 Tax=Ixodes ricinus TaxID=34613 RepID=A0A6B0UG16_IXORI
MTVGFFFFCISLSDAHVSWWDGLLGGVDSFSGGVGDGVLARLSLSLAMFSASTVSLVGWLRALPSAVRLSGCAARPRSRQCGPGCPELALLVLLLCSRSR